MLKFSHLKTTRLFRWLLLVSIASSFCPMARAQKPGGATPPDEVRKALLEKLLSEDDLGECLKEFGQDALDGFNRYTLIEEVDFNSDGHPEYLITTQDKCSCGAQNCNIAIYQQTSGGFQPLLAGNGISFDILKTSHSGYFDTVITAHNSAATVYREFYFYNGKQYKNSHSTFVNLETGESKPSERQIVFKKGASAETVSGKVSLGFPDTWVLRARAGQTLSLSFAGPQNALSYFVSKPDYSSLVSRQGGNWTGVLPADGDYRVIVEAERARSYRLTVSVN